MGARDAALASRGVEGEGEGSVASAAGWSRGVCVSETERERDGRGVIDGELSNGLHGKCTSAAGGGALGSAMKGGGKGAQRRETQRTAAAHLRRNATTIREQPSDKRHSSTRELELADRGDDSELINCNALLCLEDGIEHISQH